jgi:hypothetical protein
MSVSVGDKFGKLTVKRIAIEKPNENSKRRQSICYCDCDCGTTNVRRTSVNLTSRKISSCGCYISGNKAWTTEEDNFIKNNYGKINAKEMGEKLSRTERSIKHRINKLNLAKEKIEKRHNKSNHPLYRTHFDIKRRCYSKNREDYKDYGAKGIKMCQEWLDDFMNFYNWSIDNGWTEDCGLSIHRKNNSGDYCPENCMWADNIIQANLRSNNHNITAFGETKTMADWIRDERCLSSYGALKYRIKSGINPEIAITTPTGLSPWGFETERKAG